MRKLRYYITSGRFRDWSYFKREAKATAMKRAGQGFAGDIWDKQTGAQWYWEPGDTKLRPGKKNGNTRSHQVSTRFASVGACRHSREALSLGAKDLFLLRDY